MDGFVVSLVVDAIAGHRDVHLASPATGICAEIRRLRVLVGIPDHSSPSTTVDSQADSFRTVLHMDRMDGGEACYFRAKQETVF
jgi:hypothetical protein